MRLGISKSKNTINYYVIKDYTKNGKRSTKHPSFAVSYISNVNLSLIL